MSNFISKNKLADRSIRLKFVTEGDWEGDTPSEEIVALADFIPGSETGGIAVDSKLSDTSKNPVQNQAITKKLLEVEDKIPTSATIENVAKKAVEGAVKDELAKTDFVGTQEVEDIIASKVRDLDIEGQVDKALSGYDMVTGEEVDEKVEKAVDNAVSSLSENDINNIWKEI